MNVISRKPIGLGIASGRAFGLADAVVLLGIAAGLYAAVRLASPNPILGPEINLDAAALPWYTLLSLARMTASYLLSLAFALVFGYVAARNRAAERVMMPILDILQSVPLLSFLPVVMVLLTTLLPERLGIEAASVVLIFTGQAWNLAYSFFQSNRTVPEELAEASGVFRMNWWYRLRYLELPFGANGLLWNSVVSWANGWFFLMAAETFRVGSQDFRLPGLGSYLQAAADRGDGGAIALGFGALVLVIVLLDQLVWQPLLAWADKFSPDLAAQDEARESWFFDFLGRSRIASAITSFLANWAARRLDRRLGGPARIAARQDTRRGVWRIMRWLVGIAALGLVAVGVFQLASSLLGLPLATWGEIAAATVSSAGRVALALVIGLAWTLPVGVLIGINPRMASRLQSLVQIFAAVPATAFFPVLVLLFVRLPAGLDIAAVLLMLLGTQWYLLFNIIAGASALPQNLKDVARMFRLKGGQRWRTLILPALFPYIVTGLNIAAGGAWNASIVAEYTQYNNAVYSVAGLGSTIAHATARADYTLLLAATLTMIITVVLTNRLIWNRLHDYAQEHYRMD
ncbi:MAG: ABC transporter permease subunit [Anaerolineae bacterium]|nr:ABC transporter permease subunit [Anaerolineae bacterium]